MLYEWITDDVIQAAEVKAACDKYKKAKKSTGDHVEYNKWFDYWFDYLHLRHKFIHRYEKENKQ
tara:strand:+ start:145 stop:336 length:192 start_codon:yes stop_codon:yes gene_type:complete